MGSAAASAFWRERDEYHELAREFERNIEMTHPDYVTGSRACGWCYRCPWAASSVTYFEYRGPRVDSL
jgi:hypothetical protein